MRTKNRTNLIIAVCILAAVTGIAVVMKRPIPAPGESLKNPAGKPQFDQSLPSYPGKSLKEEQVRATLSEFARIELPEKIERLATGVVYENPNTKGLISFRTDPVRIEELKNQIRSVWRTETEGQKYYNFSESVTRPSFKDIELKEHTSVFVITSSRGSLVLPEKINESLGFPDSAATKDFQLFLWLCPDTGNVRIMWQRYPDH